MTALSIRNMNFTLHTIEQVEDELQKHLPANEYQYHYWYVERRSKNGKKWVFVRDAMWTKGQAAEAFRKFYQNRNPKFRIRHLMSY